MSDLSLLENVVEKRANFVQQKDMLQTNLQQLIGAIFACDVLIKEHEDKLKEKLHDECSDENVEKQGDNEPQEGV